MSLPFDQAVQDWITCHPNLGLSRLAVWASDSANGSFVLPATAALLGWSWRLRRKTAAQLWLGALLAFALAGMLADGIKAVTGRSRPNAAIPAGWYGPHPSKGWSITHHELGSFPSGHVAAAAGFAGVFFFAQRRVRFLAALYIGSVAWARIQLGCHHLSDTLAGLTLGLTVAYWSPRLLFTGRLARAWSGGWQELTGICQACALAEETPRADVVSTMRAARHRASLGFPELPRG